MKDLQEKMEYGEDDFAERLGRKKPDVEIAKISVGKPEGLMGEEEEMEEIDSYLYDLTTNTKQKIVNSQSLLTSLNPIQYVIPRGY